MEYKFGDYVLLRRTDRVGIIDGISNEHYSDDLGTAYFIFWLEHNKFSNGGRSNNVVWFDHEIEPYLVAEELNAI